MKSAASRRRSILADRLARAADPEAKAILANTIIILVPSQNPDGVDIVGDYYRSTLGTPNEGTRSAGLYHKYVGHDDNRDWYAFTQVETRYTVDSLYTPWDPQIVNDIHQQGSDAGTHLHSAVHGSGRAEHRSDSHRGDERPRHVDGVADDEPGLHRHRAATRRTTSGRRRASTRSIIAARACSPRRRARVSRRRSTFRSTSFGAGRGYEAKTVDVEFPVGLAGRTLEYGDIVRYQTAASWALFLEAAQNRRAWLEGYAAQADRALGALPAWGTDTWPTAIVIPKTQPDTQALKRMIWTLQHGQVEIRESTAPVTVEGKSYPAGSYVVLTKQPFGDYAKTLLERQHYPDLFEYPGGPPQASVRRHRAHAAAALRRRRRARHGRAAGDRRGAQGDSRAGVFVGR